MANENTVHGYAILIERVGNPEQDRLWREIHCPTCGDPYLRAGPRCPECENRWKASLALAEEALKDYFDSRPRMTHVYGVGLVDPLSREGKNLLGDG